MKKTIICLVMGILASFSHLLAQKNTVLQHQIERLAQEKLRGWPLEKMIEWQRQHPGEPFPSAVWNTDASAGAQERNSDQLISGNPRAESEVHAAINPTDSANIITAAIIQDPGSFSSPINVPVRYTTNFGATWQSSSIQFNPNGGGLSFTAGGGDPVLAFDKSGKAYLSWLVLSISLLSEPPVELALYASTSTNKGQSWSAPVLVDKGGVPLEVLTGGAGAGELVDKQWMAVDRSNSTYEGNLYVSYTKFTIIDSVNGTAQILLKRKPKNSNAFSATPVQVHSGTYAIVQFSSIDVDQQGQVHVSFFAGNTLNDMGLYHSVSTNGGQNFSPEVKITPLYYPRFFQLPGGDTIAGVSGDRLYPCPHIAVGKTPGLLYATWTANGLTGPLTEGYDVWFSKSEDNGANWSAPTRVNPGADEAAEQYYSAIAVNDNGVVCLSYYDRNDDPQGTLTDYVVCYSFDGGNTFTTPVKANALPSDFDVIGQLNGGFGIGEYTQIVCTPTTAIPVWADGRTNDGNIEIYGAFLPISSLPSSVFNYGVISDAVELSFPNPARTLIEAQVTLKRATRLQVELWTTDGRKATEAGIGEVLREGVYTYALKAPSPGQYLLRVQTDFGAVVKKVVVLP